MQMVELDIHALHNLLAHSSISVERQLPTEIEIINFLIIDIYLSYTMTGSISRLLSQI